MLDTNYIEYLFSSLSQEEKRELLRKLFGGAKQSINYFKKIKDPGLSKLEILADFFEMPIDGLRLDSKFRRNPSENEEESIYKAMIALSKKYDKYCLQNQADKKSLPEFIHQEILQRINVIDFLKQQSQ